MSGNGLIHLYYGDGKGKTSAAFGACMRAAGHDLKVGVAQFLKSGTSGEIKLLSSFSNVTIFPHIENIKFVFAMSENDKIEARDFYHGLMEKIIGSACGFDIICLDELGSALEEGFVDKDSVVSLFNLEKRPEMIITAHNAPEFMIDYADYVSRMFCEKHPYERGVHARKGIEW